jgi:hypothetical protein
VGLNPINLRRTGIKHFVAGIHRVIETGLLTMENCEFNSDLS